MARRKSLDSAFTSVLEGVVRDTMKDQMKSVRRELAELRREVSKLRSRPGGRGGRRRGGGRKPIHTHCQVADCNRKHQSRGLCQRHYNRLRNRGTLDFWADKIKAGETVRESMIAAQRGVPLKQRPKVKKRKKKARKKAAKRKSSGKRKSKSKSKKKK